MEEQFKLDVYSEELFDLLKEGDGTYDFDGRFIFGFDELDRRIGTFLPGDLMLITSDKPLGKTSLILNSIVDNQPLTDFSRGDFRFEIFQMIQFHIHSPVFFLLYHN